MSTTLATVLDLTERLLAEDPPFISDPNVWWAARDALVEKLHDFDARSVLDLSDAASVERLAAAIGSLAIEDRDRVIAGDYRADTYAVHATRLIASLRGAPMSVEGESFTESLRRRLRDVGMICPTCGQPTAAGGLRALAARIGIPHSVLWRFLQGKDMSGRNIDTVVAYLEREDPR